MNTRVPQNNVDQEIDLVQISQKINRFFKEISRSIFNGIQFFVRNWIVLLVLIVLGFGVGLFLDKTHKNFEHQIIVTPNFASTDYLYSKIELIESKINENDTVFLKEIVGISKPSSISKIEIKPIIDVYNFIKDKPENFELIKVMAEDGNIKSVLEEKMTSKNYSFQTIVLHTKERLNNTEVILPILNFLNTSDYYNKVQKEVYNGLVFKMEQNDSIIKQIDGILNNFSTSAKSSFKNDKLMYYNENTQLSDIIKTKDELIKQQASLRIELINSDKTIKDSSITFNILQPKLLKEQMKLLLPLLFVTLFVLISMFIFYYKNQKSMTNL